MFPLRKVYGPRKVQRPCAALPFTSMRGLKTLCCEKLMLSEALGQLPNVRVPLRPPEPFSFPNAVLGENRHHSIRIMGVIANVTVFGFSLLIASMSWRTVRRFS